MEEKELANATYKGGGLKEAREMAQKGVAIGAAQSRHMRSRPLLGLSGREVDLLELVHCI